MSNFSLYLKTQNDITKLSLFPKDPEDLTRDYFEKENEEYLYNDYLYFFSILDELGNAVTVENVFINGEMIDDIAFLSGRKSSCVFRECFGVVKIEAIINGESYVTHNTRIAMKENSINSSIINMIDYIYDNCDEYLYEEHKYSKTGVGVMPNPKVSIDTKLALLEEIYDVYIKSYSLLRDSAQNKLVATNKIGSFNELQSIRQNTINYIVNHPEELRPVNYNSGISVNNQYYEPRKTLVQSATYSYDIYENKVLVGFIKTIIQELEEIIVSVEKQKRRSTSPYKKNGYIDSAYYIYTKNIKMLNDYITSINAWLEKFKSLYLEYRKILEVEEIEVTNIPQYTDIFQHIVPYNIVFEKIVKWFSCGNYDLLKSDLLLSFVSISKIYEYFCLIKINRVLEKCGYEMISSFSFKYTEKRYYQNIIYNNTFEFSKDSTTITVYFQPVIHGKTYKGSKTNDIGLFRNTTISITEPSVLAMLDEREPQRGSYYNPDFLLKINNGNGVSYHILDAKHSSAYNVCRYQLPYLVYKYFFSISTFKKGSCVDSMCILCGKESNNSSKNLYDIAETMSTRVSPLAQICCVTGNDVSDDLDLIKYIKKIEHTD